MVIEGDNLFPIVFPDYQNSILNVTSSILKYYGVSTHISSNQLLDKELQKKYRNVVYILVDALGVETLRRHEPVSKSLNKDFKQTITSVFPSTTVAATTAVLTGLPPITTGWLGWCQYVKEVDKSVIFFKNQDYYNDSTVFNQNMSNLVAPVKKIYDLIEDVNDNVKTVEIFPAFSQSEHNTFMKQCHTIVSTCKEKGKHFIYTYWDQLDFIMHETGPGSIEANKMLESIDKGYHYLTESIEDDTIIILIADHGQVEVCPIELRKYPKLWDTFIHEPSIESRATAFFIKPDRKAEFEEKFNHYFREYYMLLTKEEVLKMDLFGYGKKHPRIDEFLGDYLAIAIGHFYFRLSTDKLIMRGQHAGLLKEEMQVPLIIHTKK
ncbi:MAG: alkaline phosphatase family protein [Candidatus Izemoplasmatales bacterium]|nr:alkaline phosphatase family protein [Candidatus Izemoplasmatales bacterium]